METDREESMTKGEVATLIEQIPQGLTPDDFLVVLAHLAAATEREACEKVCHDLHIPEDSDYHWIPDGRGALKLAAEIIRQRGTNGF